MSSSKIDIEKDRAEFLRLLEAYRLAHPEEISLNLHILLRSVKEARHPVRANRERRHD